MNQDVGSILNRNRVFYIGPSATVLDAVQTMKNEGIGAIVITREDQVVGIFTERDLLNKVVAPKLDPAVTRLEEVMTTPVITCKTSTSLSKCRHLMLFKNIRHAPVVDNGELVGMISLRDLMDALMVEKKQLSAYIDTQIFQKNPPPES